MEKCLPRLQRCHGSLKGTVSLIQAADTQTDKLALLNGIHRFMLMNEKYMHFHNIIRFGLVGGADCCLKSYNLVLIINDKLDTCLHGYFVVFVQHMTKKI